MMIGYQPSELTKAALEASQASVLLNFGVDGCPHCMTGNAQLAQFSVDPARLINIQDGAGRRLGRTFRVKWWPTYIVLKDGVECARLVRPTQPCDWDVLMPYLR